MYTFHSAERSAAFAIMLVMSRRIPPAWSITWHLLARNCVTLSCGLRRVSAAVHSIHFGGGTPTFLDADQIRAIMAAIRTKAHLDSHTEVTWESTPDTIDRTRIAALVESGCNRLSIGAQCLDAGILGMCNRHHTPDDVEQAFSLARESGIENINFDVIFGLPRQTPEIWMDTITKVVRLGVSSLTVYHLRIKAGTPVALLPKSAFPAEGQCDDMYLACRRYLLEHGYVQSTPSCFIRSWGQLYRHQHHKAYGGEYIGLGMSAYSYCGQKVWFNTRDVAEYEGAVNGGFSAARYGKVLTADEATVRRIILALRYGNGVDILNASHDGVPELLTQDIGCLVDSGYLSQASTILTLTQKGMLRADEVCAVLVSTRVQEKARINGQTNGRLP